MSAPSVVVLDYGFGNVHSAAKALEAAGAEVTLTADPQAAIEAAGLLIPGVGSFPAVMAGLERVDGARIVDQRLAGARPVLGICVGMQVMFERGLEGVDADLPASFPEIRPDDRPSRVHARNASEFWWDDVPENESPGTEGLGQWPGVVRRIDAQRLPHIGWNVVTAAAGSALFDGLAQERFYFVNSYAATAIEFDEIIPQAAPVLQSHTTYGERFLAAVENGPLSATQFHPEKSGKAGIQLLRNWLRTL